MTESTDAIFYTRPDRRYDIAAFNLRAERNRNAVWDGTRISHTASEQKHKAPKNNRHSAQTDFMYIYF